MREKFFVLKVFVAMFLMCLLGWESAKSKELWYKRDYYVGNYSGGEGNEKYLSTKAMANATIVHSDGSATALRLVEADSSTDDSRIYNLQGIEQKDDTHQHGIYIKGGRKYVK